jgi:hypothetical protein
MSTTAPTLTIYQVVDLDCIVSMVPLIVDLPTTERYVTGPRAIAYRVVYAWVNEAQLLELEGSYGPGDLAVLRALLASLAEDEDFVRTATVTITQSPDGSQLAIACILDLSGVGPYPFEVTAANAVNLVFPS